MLFFQPHRCGVYVGFCLYDRRKNPESDRRWKNYLVLLDIIDIVFSPLISEDHISYLHLLIEEHHHAF